jgi:hypothetical protein
MRIFRKFSCINAYIFKGLLGHKNPALTGDIADVTITGSRYAAVCIAGEWQQPQYIDTNIHRIPTTKVRIRGNTLSLRNASSHIRCEFVHEKDLHQNHTEEIAKWQNRKFNSHKLRNYEC